MKPPKLNLGKELHVSVGAVAGGTGTEAQPFASLKAVLDAIAQDDDWTGSIVMHPGKHSVTEEAVLPKTATWKLMPGTTIAAGPGVSIHAQNDVDARGTESSPILFTWLEKDKHWGSLTNFTKGSDNNVFEYVTFEHGYESDFEGVGMRGALSLKNAKARISHCQFINNEGDDGLNLKATDTLVEYSLFKGNASDGIDSDGVGKPEIRFCTFDNQINDNLDLGEGTSAFVHHNLIMGGQDKGISNGDGATPTLENNLIVNNFLGIGIKDDADPMVRNNTIYGNQYGIRLYHHVDDYGNAKGTVVNNIIWGSALQDVMYEAGDTVFKYNCIGSLKTEEGEDVIDNTGALLADMEGILTVGTGCDDPGFVDPANLDFHLKSEAGRWDASSESWVKDKESSPAIDRGDPDQDVGDEPAPNGGRINLGAEGGTEEASKSP
ncbi:MAG TPA: right-handed parallel beta-helix repeat-containing protein [Polyangiaceae bacterium]|nr:right-handed parallel beta-helix repeat-containing protein [Polyangiaceae bacterium]